jgi:DNA-binding transcriptional ArsR family regulator
MVRYMPQRSVQEPTSLDRLFQALADPTRRAVVHRLCVGPASTTELARPFPMALTSFAQHMQVLEAAGLVRSTKTGRVRIFTLDPLALRPAAAWLEEQRTVWTQRLDRLDAFLLADTPDDTVAPDDTVTPDQIDSTSFTQEQT